jgi:serine/threonine protein kinase
MPNILEYTIGRSKACDVPVQIAANEEYSERHIASMELGKSMISNRHCKIFQRSTGGPVYIEDNSGNGTFINQQTRLRRGQTRILHSGDEICLVNPANLRKKIKSARLLQLVLQQFSFIFVQTKTRKSCVNPRAMNYAHNTLPGEGGNGNAAASPQSSRRIEAFYELLEVLGDGTSGQVRRAIHRQTGQEVAVKVISLRRKLDMSAMEREVQLMKKLDHPYITSLKDVFVQPAVAMYIVMELVKGGDLFDQIVQKTRYSEVEARRTMRRLLSAVFYLHETKNIVHRDLKPENVLCCSPTEVKLADFGLAKIVKADGLKTFCGTPAYFAPEVLQRRSTVAGQGRYGKPADIWSLGTILYILLSGRPPFDADLDESHNHFELDFETDEAIWADLPLAKDLVQSMLRLDPKRRITVRQCCDHPWINIEDGDTHCHPFDDPAITTKKRLFEEVERSNQMQQNQNEAQNEDELLCNFSMDDWSVLSKEEFAQAAISHHSRTDSFFHVDNNKIGSAIEKKGPAASPKASNGHFQTKEQSISSPVQSSERPNSPSPRDVKSMSMSSADISSEEVNADEKKANVPSNAVDSVDEARSPLEKLNLNDRCNRFRDHVLQTVNDAGNEKDDYQTAVTPTSSNVRKKEEQRGLMNAEEGGDILDPILSQFSSEPSSIESFSDCSDTSTSSRGNNHMQYSSKSQVPTRIEGDAKKRRFEENTAATTTSTPSKSQPKRARISLSNSKQTTLTSWFVKKDN